jgi:hypothetical protein
MIQLTVLKDNQLSNMTYNWDNEYLYSTIYSKMLYRYCRRYIRKQINKLLFEEYILIDIMCNKNTVDLALYIIDYYKIITNNLDKVYPITIVYDDNTYFTYNSDCNIFKNRRQYLKPSLKILNRKEKKIFSELYDLKGLDKDELNSFNISTN